LTSKIAVPKVEISKKQRLVYIFVLGFLFMVQTLVTDMFLPAFPKIAAFFQVPDAFIQYSLSAVMLGAAIGFFVAGPLSDSMGRKKPAMMALALFTISSGGLYLAPGIEAFVILRFLQGLAGAAAAVVTQAIIRDLFVGNAMLKMLSRVWLISGIAPLVSPMISAQLLLVAPDWRIIPLALAALGLLILGLASRALVETLHKDNRRSKGFEGVNKRFIAVFRDRILVGLVIIGMAQHLSLFSYLNIIPFLYQDSLGLTPVEFSAFFSITALCWFLGIQVGAKLGRIFRAQWVVFAALVMAVVAGAGLYLVGSMNVGIETVLPIMAVYMASFGMSITPIQTIALQGHGSEAGTAASVLGVMNSFVAAAAAPLYPLIGSETTTGLGITILIAHMIAIAVFFLVVRPRSVPDLVKEKSEVS
jgi:DHA1 family bicyclomycin/chloramphenicol resistance-like MFS transporter